MHIIWIFILGVLCGGLIMLSLISLTADRTEKLFVYGTLMNPVIRTYACGCFVGGTPATLQGFRKVERNIVPDPYSVVAGQLLTLSKRELRVIDRYERTPTYYRRESIQIGDEDVFVYFKHE